MALPKAAINRSITTERVEQDVQEEEEEDFWMIQGCDEKEEPPTKSYSGQTRDKMLETSFIHESMCSSTENMNYYRH